MPGLSVRKLADQTVVRAKMFDPLTGEPALMLPEDAEALKEALAEISDLFKVTPRPLIGVVIEGETPDAAKLPTGWVARGKSEGWIEVEGEEVVHRSAGPPEDPWGGEPAHTFVHYDRIVLKTVDGDVVYEVVENPDKWPEEKDGKAGFGGEVRHFYEVKLGG